MNKKKFFDFIKSINALRLLFVILIFSSIASGHDRFSDDFEKLGSLILAGLLAIAIAITYFRRD
ncbi:hypothetical protein EV195_101177 [Tenacibaculum skagerrakense]|uniref:Uncharacterized protein n=1 Tax=Tenacibaculum skagerrakense TaxID=186571 RepID=A0A4R2P1R8_9FLAO|nr:hypothetical protein [Tenacibaculum skagerrakense]TCP28018.1 hypothetical protein EV195_101177 [Tenacibaculum skagerrakense]